MLPDLHQANQSFHVHQRMEGVMTKIGPCEPKRHKLHCRHAGAIYPLLHRPHAQISRGRDQISNSFEPSCAKFDVALALIHHEHLATLANKSPNRHTQEMNPAFRLRHQCQQCDPPDFDPDLYSTCLI